MDWDLKEAVEYYKRQGAPEDQAALIFLLREAQQVSGGALPEGLITQLAQHLGVRESLLLALVRRIPDLRLARGHTLEICGGPNCSKRAALTALAETHCGENVTLKTVPCMRLCGKGPNLRWDGTLYHQADGKLLRELLKSAEEGRS